MTRGDDECHECARHHRQPDLPASQPSDRSTAGSAISRANHEAGTAEAATALRTTVALRITSTGRNPSGRRRTVARTAGTPRTSSAAPTAPTTSPPDGDCTSSTIPAAVRATRTAPTMSSRAPLPSVESARHRNGTTRAPRIGSAITARQPNAASTRPPIQRPEAAHRRGHARQPTEGEPAHRSAVASREHGHTQRRHGGSAGTLEHAGAEQHLEGRGHRRHERTDRHQHQARQERGADADEVGDASVERGGHREHQDVEADRSRPRARRRRRGRGPGAAASPPRSTSPSRRVRRAAPAASRCAGSRPAVRVSASRPLERSSNGLNSRTVRRIPPTGADSPPSLVRMSTPDPAPSPRGRGFASMDERPGAGRAAPGRTPGLRRRAREGVRAAQRRLQRRPAHLRGARRAHDRAPSRPGRTATSRTSSPDSPAGILPAVDRPPRPRRRSPGGVLGRGVLHRAVRVRRHDVPALRLRRSATACSASCCWRFSCPA